MSHFKRYVSSSKRVEVVAEHGKGGDLELLPHQFRARDLYDAWQVVEDNLFKLGYGLFQEGLPLGLIVSDGFNPLSKMDGVASPEFMARYNRFMGQLRSLALRDSPLSTSVGDKTKQDLELALWLLENTYCYVSYIEGLDSETDDKKFISGKVNTSTGTYNEALLNELGIDIPDRVIKGINKMIEGLATDLKSGLLPFPVVEFNKQTIKVPRKKMSFARDEYMITPVSLVMGWVKGLREAMRDNLVIINARKTEGALREFVLTSSAKAVGDVYDRDQEVIELFETSRSLPSQYPYFKSRVYNWEGLHNLNMTYFELGIPKEDYPKRALNLNRVVSIELVPVDDGDRYKSLIRQVKRYANVDVDVVVSQVTHVVKDWEVERMVEFMNATLNKLKGSLGATADSDVKIKSFLDFRMKFGQAMEHYSTSYLRSVVDYMLEHPTEFDNFTGNNYRVSDVVASSVSSAPVGQIVNLDDDDDLSFD